MRGYVLTERERVILVKHNLGEELTRQEQVVLSKLRALARNEVIIARIKIDVGLLEKLAKEVK